MKSLYAVPHHEFAIHELLVSLKGMFARAGAAAWDAISSTGPRREMPLDEIERYVSEAADPDDEIRRLRAWDDYVGRMRGFPPRM
jgi:hypothetical protein